MDDLEREEAIDYLKLKYLGARTTAERRVLWNAMRELINGRSARQVERMERNKGLRAA